MKLKKIMTCVLAAAIAAGGIMSGRWDYSRLNPDTVLAAETTVYRSQLESTYIVWAPANGADGYNVYIKPEGGSFTQLDPMLIRQYSGYFRADAVGLKAGKYAMKIVPTANGKEIESGAYTSDALTVTANDRTGFGWINGTSSGAYNEDGTLKNGAVVLYVTESTKDTVSMDVVTSSKGTTTNGKGLQAILDLYKKGYETRPLDIRVVGNVTDPSYTVDGDIVIDGGKKVNCGITVEGVGNDAVINGFGIRIKSISNVEVRNLGFMNCDSKEGDDVGLQQDNDHVWVHNCDFFYGDAGSDADQVKGDGALDCKKSTYITFSYNHFWDNGKCNLLGLSEGTTEGLYITYHHNWYDHSDSRHPRVRYYSAHVYNNLYDGNAKYGIGSTLGSSVFSENNYFRNCKYPMLTAMQGSDTKYADNPSKGTFSGEDGGTIKAYGNMMTGQKAFTPYSENNTDFDAYVASSRDEKVPASVVSKKGGNTYNNFDTNSSLMYKYTPDKAEEVPAKVMADAGRIDGGDFKWKFDNSVDDASYAVNDALKAALVAYKTPVLAIGSGFYAPGTEPEQPTQPAVTTVNPSTTTNTKPVDITINPATTVTTAKPSPSQGYNAIYCSPSAASSGKGTISDPTDVLSAISMVQPGQIIFMLGGTYRFDKTIVIDSKNCGTKDKYKLITPYPGDSVVWDFSALATDPSNRGVVLDGDYWAFSGFEITKAGDNGMLLSGSNNIIEKMVFNDNQDTGLQISRYDSKAEFADWPADNWVVGCTSKNNCDDATMENADGFAAKLTCGNGNVFDNCMAYNNSDDGWDLFAKTGTGPIGVVVIRNCIAFRNGYTEFGEGFGDCDGNGFKLGGSGVGSAHVVMNCLAFENLNCGFTDNNNPKLDRLVNCTAYNNGVGGNGKPNVSCYRCTDDGCDFSKMITYINNDKLNAFCGANDKLTAKLANDKFVGTIEKSVYYNSGYYYVDAKTKVDNGDKIGEKGVGPSADDFVSLERPDYRTVVSAQMPCDFHKEWRKENGAIDTHGFLELKGTSKFAGLGSSFADVEYPKLIDINFENPPETVPPATTVTTPATAATTTTTTTAVIEPVTTVTKEPEPPVSVATQISLVIGTTTTAQKHTETTVNTTAAPAETTTENKTTASPSSGTNPIYSTIIVSIVPVTSESAPATTRQYATSAVPATSIVTMVSGYMDPINSQISVGVVTSVVTASGTDIITIPVTEKTNVKTTAATTTKVHVTENLPDGTLYGDVNLDGKVDIADVVALNMYLLSNEDNPLEDGGRANADCRRDNSIDTTDSTLLMNYVAEIIKLSELGKK